jgi:hypothetical protein
MGEIEAPEGVGMRRCKRCGETKPLVEFVEAKDCAQGRRPVCKKCKYTSDTARRRARRPPTVCRACKQPKEGKRCRPCLLASYRRYRQRHAEERRSRARGRYSSGPKGPTQARTRRARWRTNNREHYLTKKREQSARRRERDRQARAAADPVFRAKLEAKRRRQNYC